MTKIEPSYTLAISVSNSAAFRMEFTFTYLIALIGLGLALTLVHSICQKYQPSTRLLLYPQIHHWFRGTIRVSLYSFTAILLLYLTNVLFILLPGLDSGTKSNRAAKLYLINTLPILLGERIHIVLRPLSFNLDTWKTIHRSFGALMVCTAATHIITAVTGDHFQVSSSHVVFGVVVC